MANTMDSPSTHTPASLFQKRQIGWTLLSNHGHVLLCLSRNPQLRLRDVALEVGITERAVQRIVADLEQCGFLTIQKVSRNNSYKVNSKATMRHPLEKDICIGEFLRFLQ